VDQGGAIPFGGHLVQPGAGVPGRLRRRLMDQAEHVRLVALTNLAPLLQPAFRHLHVGIQEGQPGMPGGGGAPVTQSGDAQAGAVENLRAPFAGDARTVVAGAVVDHDDLPLAGGALGRHAYRLDRSGDVPGLVEPGNDDADGLAHAGRTSCGTVAGACRVSRRMPLDIASRIHSSLLLGMLRNSRNMLNARKVRPMKAASWARWSSPSRNQYARACW